MEKSTTHLNYDERNDMLYIYKDGYAKGNLVVGNIILDVTSKGNVIGIEIHNVTQMFENFTKDILRSASHAQLTVLKKRDTLTISFSIAAPQQPRQEAAVVIPTLTPLRAKER